MDLLGLSQSINGLVSEAFDGYHVEQGRTDGIDHLFDADEAMHIFRIIQLLTDGILEHKPSGKIVYTITCLSSSVDFDFSIQGTLQHPGSFPNISNRLELLNGRITVRNRPLTTHVKVSIPFAS
jgi:hypothetical protein